jgi:hypothetical protein
MSETRVSGKILFGFDRINNQFGFIVALSVVGVCWQKFLIIMLRQKHIRERAREDQRNLPHLIRVSELNAGAVVVLGVICYVWNDCVVYIHTIFKELLL